MLGEQLKRGWNEYRERVQRYQPGLVRRRPAMVFDGAVKSVQRPSLDHG
jgi:hypothetical protein